MHVPAVLWPQSISEPTFAFCFVSLYLCLLLFSEMASATTEDWQLNQSVLESNKHVLENQLYCDVKFVFNEDKSKMEQVRGVHTELLGLPLRRR